MVACGEAGLTIIAYKDGEMAADCGMWNGTREVRVPFPKITRAADGSLWAASGKAQDAWFLREWVIAGADMGNLPEFIGKDDERPSVIMAKSDGSLWSCQGELRLAPCAPVGCWGAGDASHFCEGALEAGLSAGDAVRLTIQHHLYAGIDVQIERIRVGDPATIIQIRPEESSDDALRRYLVVL